MADGDVTLKIPRPLYNRLATVIEGTGFHSVTEFCVYVLRDLVATHEQDVGRRRALPRRVARRARPAPGARLPRRMSDRAAGLRRRGVALRDEPAAGAAQRALAALGLGRDALLRRPPARGSPGRPARRRRRASAASGTSSRSRTARSARRAIPPRADRPRRAARAGRRARRHRRRVLRGALPAARAAPRQAPLGGEDAAPRVPDRRHPGRVPRRQGGLRRARPARRDRLVPRLARRGGAARRRGARRARRPTGGAAGARTTSSSSACCGAASSRRRTRRSRKHGPERVRVERFEAARRRARVGRARAVRLARAATSSTRCWRSRS